MAEVLRGTDAAHVTWQAVGSSYWACSDQIVSEEAKASRDYPRVITSARWLSCAATAAVRASVARRTLVAPLTATGLRPRMGARGRA